MKESCGDAEIGVLRQNGADGIIGVKWRTIDKSAINGKDYSGGEGEIKFRHGEVKRNLCYCLFFIFSKAKYVVQNMVLIHFLVTKIYFS